MCIHSLSAVCVQMARLGFEDPVSFLGSCSIVLGPVYCSRPFRMMWDIAGVVGPCRILQDCVGPCRIPQDHVWPYRTLWDHVGPCRII